MQTTTKDFEIQPIIDINSNRVCGGEILWRPGGQRLTADLIERLNEDPQLNTEVSKYALILGLNTISKINSEAWISINLPTQFIGDGNYFFKSVSKEIADLDFLMRKAGKRLVIELSENDVATESGLKLINRLSQIHSIAIDDFGAGSAPLSHMLNVNFEKVKIDRSIISGCDSDPKKQRFLSWLLGGCHSIDVSVCAEGIETESELAFLKRIRTDMGQGYLWSRSVPVEDFENMAVPVQSAVRSLGQIIES